MNRLFPAHLSTPAATGLLILRLVAGLALMMHGLPKIQNAFGWMGPDSWAPGFLQALAALAEFGGGLALMLGLLTPIAAFGILCVMLTAVFGVHVPKGDPFVGKGGSYELAAIYAAIATMLMFTGPGKFSLDAKLFRKTMASNAAGIGERIKAGFR